MLSHQSGGIKGTRLGSPNVVHTIPVTFADATAVAKKLLTISPQFSASPGTAVFEPVFFRINAVIEIANDAGTSAALAVGTNSTSYNNAIAAFDMKGAVGANATQAANPVKMALADTDIYAVPTIVGSPTVGKVHVIVEVWGGNINEPTNQGS